MQPKFNMWTTGTGHTWAEVEASALNRAAALSGWQGPLRITKPYELREVPDRDPVKGQVSELDAPLVCQARTLGHTIWASIQVVSDEPDTLDLNAVLAEGLNAVDAWEIADLGSDMEREAAFTLTEAFSTIHATLRDGGRLPDPWAGAAGQAPQADALTVTEELNRVFRRLGAVLDKLDAMSYDISPFAPAIKWAEDYLSKLENSAARNPAQEQVVNAFIHRMQSGNWSVS